MVTKKGKAKPRAFKIVKIKCWNCRELVCPIVAGSFLACPNCKNFVATRAGG